MTLRLLILITIILGAIGYACVHQLEHRFAMEDRV